MSRETPPELRRALEALSGLTAAELATRYEALTGEPPHTRSRRYLERRVAWLLQAAEYGGLSDAARRRAHELARLSDLRLTPPKQQPREVVRAPVKSRRGPDLPPPGTLLTRTYRGQDIRVLVLDDGHFEWDGVVYRSLSAIAKAVTGSHCSGPAWFGLVERKRSR